MALTEIPASTWTDLPAPTAGSRAFSNTGSNDVVLSFTGAVEPTDGIPLGPKSTVFFDTGSDWVGKQFAAYSVMGSVVSTTAV